jgi:two-component system response regulator HydG
MLEADLRLREYETEWFTSPVEAFEALKGGDVDVVVTDYKMPGMTGTQLCERIVANRPDIPVIVMTAFGSMETAIEAMGAGAYYFVNKPVEMDMLAMTLERAIRQRELQEKVKILSEAVERSKRFGELLGSSPPMQRLYEQLSQISETDASVLITGESGTGKELVARAIHDKSDRHEGPLVAINCAALPDTLLESELFGHAKGAFTDARSARRGLFLQAEKGTLFLDEIGDFPMSVQAKMLRALEGRTVRPVGGDEEIAFDVRLITATNRDLESAVDEERFREDLYFRINVIQVEVPPLRARGTDILLLAQHFVELFAASSGKAVAGISNAVAEKLLGYSWPGNVRELRNVIERAVALTRYDNIAVDDLPEKIRDYKCSQVFIGGSDPTELVPLEEVERRYILHVLRSLSGNKTLASRVLGLDRKTLYRKLQQYGSGEAEP